MEASHRLFFVVPAEVHLLDIAGPAHVFYEAAAYGKPITSHYIGMDERREVASSAGVTFSQVESFESYTLGPSDILFIPGLESQLFFDEGFVERNASFYSWLCIQSGNGAKICSVCTGAYLLAQAGLLDGKSCATHWKYMEDFQYRFPNTELKKDRLFVKDGNIYSSAGVASGIDLSLYILEELYSPVFATDIAKEIVVYLRRTEADPQLSVFLQFRNHIENRVHLAQDFISQHLQEHIKIERLADEVNMSPRNLISIFRSI